MKYDQEEEFKVKVLCDEDGNEVLNKDGTIKEFYCKGRLKTLFYLFRGR